MNDNTTNIDRIKKAIARFIEERDWEQFHSPKNLSMSITIEAAELMELFQWMTVEEACSKSDEPELRQRIEEEIADIVIYAISLCNTLGVDLSSAIERKLAHNAKRYPKETCRGTW
jgi:NTP pyrophosphatase (non-canonical NTP hydrolase)